MVDHGEVVLEGCELRTERERASGIKMSESEKVLVGNVGGGRPARAHDRGRWHRRGGPWDPRRRRERPSASPRARGAPPPSSGVTPSSAAMLRLAASEVP